MTMSDFILVEGDTVQFEPVFGAANVTVRPGQLVAHVTATIQGRKISVVGDEKNVLVPGCAYVTATHTIPGLGTLTIANLAEDQSANKTTIAGQKVLLTGSQFTAKLTVLTPAQQPPPGPGSPTPDTTLEYQGMGRFINSNQRVKGS
jgi:hypothetical protein